MKYLLVIVSLFLSVSAFASMPPTVLEQWGGRGINLLVLSDQSASMQFDCASARIETGRWPINQSRIAANGTYSRQTGVRPPPGFRPPAEIASFAANIDYSKGTMTLKIKRGTSKTNSVFKLVKDAASDIKRCL